MDAKIAQFSIPESMVFYYVNMARYFTSVRHYFHEPQASENAVKCLAKFDMGKYLTPINGENVLGGVA